MPKKKSKKSAVSGGPYLTGAFFCEKALEETDRVPTFIRVMDILTIEEPKLPAQPLGQPEIMPAVLVTLVVMLKSGDEKGKRTLRIDTVTPSLKRRKGTDQTISFSGGEGGVHLRGPVPHPVNEEGVYWHEVRLDGKLLTRIPLRVVYSPTKPDPQPLSTPGAKEKG